jgi:hypothetical protein
MYTFKTFNTPEALVDFLNGVVQSKPLPLLTSGLHGLTLIITTAGGDRTVTFADATGAGLSPRQILGQVQAADSALATAILRNYGYDSKQPCLAIMTAAQVVKSTGTANSLLGFSTTANKTVTEVVVTSIVAEQVQLLGPSYSVLIHT